jgi:transmembrane sensor
MILLNKNKINWTLLSKYLTGECSSDENKRIEEWINASGKNKALYESIQSDWEKINETEKMKKVDVNKAWYNLKNRILENEPDLDVIAGLKPGISRNYLYKAMRLAASIILLVGISFGAYKVYFESPFIKRQNTITRSGSDNTSIIILPDKSKVFLNSNTYIKYTDKFGAGRREVYLKGEAYFEIAHNEDMPFIVNTNKATVKVLGTAFNVNTQLSDKEIEVFVESGKVQLNQKSRDENNLLIEPGFIGILSKNTLNKSKNDDINYLAWKTRYLVFRETKLETVAKKLESVYNTHIIFENAETANCRLTTTFNNQSLDAILEVIKETFNLQDIVKSRKGIILVGRGC